MATETTTALRLRHWVGALTLPGLFLSLLAATLLDKMEEQGSTATQVNQAANQLGTLRALAAFELLAALLAIGAVATLVGAIRRRGTGWANAGAVVGGLGCLGMTLIGGHHLFMYALLQADRANATKVLDSLNRSTGPVVVLFFALPIALLLLAVAAWRAGVVPLAALIVVTVFFVTNQVPVLPGGELIPLLIGVVGYSWIGWATTRPDVTAGFTARESLPSPVR